MHLTKYLTISEIYYKGIPKVPQEHNINDSTIIRQH